jgi:hypothetical protein
MRTLLFIVALGSGCGLPQREVKFTDHSPAGNKVTSFSTPGDLRLAFLRPSGTAAVYCAEPMPDVALGSDASASGKLSGSASMAQASATNASLAAENEALRRELDAAIEKYERETENRYTSSTSSTRSTSLSQSSNAALNLEAAARLAVTVSELGGRTQQVLLAREFLYRLCEARANSFIENEATYTRLQENALRMIEAIYTVKPTNDTERVVANAELLKQVVAYNTQQQTRCDERLKACDAVAKTDDEKAACKKDKNECVKAIVLLKAPDLSEPKTPKSNDSFLLPPP